MIRSKEVFVLQREEIALHKDSVEFLAQVFDSYEDGKLNSSAVVKNPIVHLYATKDTKNEDGDLNGYNDALFFDAHIYDTVNDIKYVETQHDSVDIGEATMSQIKIFKDGSTMMLFFGDYKFGNTTTLSMYKAD